MEEIYNEKYISRISILNEEQGKMWIKHILLFSNWNKREK